MSKHLEVGLLLDYYGSLLTKTQYNLADLYYNQDLSLSEIAENTGITRQGVYDSIKRTEEALKKFEKKLNMKSNLYKINNIAVEILRIVDKLKKDESEEVTKIKLLINELLNEVRNQNGI